MNNNYDKIEISLPFKAEYVSIARLTSSGIANRLGFDIEVIEDIKVAIAEVCNKLVSAGSTEADFFTIAFYVYADKLKVVFNCEDKSLKCIFNSETDELGISIINALMDEVELCTSNAYLFSMSKALEGNI
ncbi:MAG: anti-sigma regulatory factor [Clostridia bacterium]|nr:anti-sigma regulatory factor [Clostridia bacterium]